MINYFATCITGVEDVVANALIKEIPDVVINAQQEGLLSFSTAAKPHNIKSLRYFNNVFLESKHFTKLNKDVFKPIMFFGLRKSSPDYIKQYLKNKRINSFRLILSIDNRLVSYNRYRVHELEKKLGYENSLKIDKSNPDIEFWINIRKNKDGFFGLRITRNSKSEHKFKGELRQDLAHVICILSNPNESDVFLDPFAGYNTIVNERSCYPSAKLIAYEENKDVIKHAATKRSAIINKDFFSSNIKDNFIDKIVTDPPWGEYKSMNTEVFYNRMLGEFNRILKSDGQIVILTSKKELFEGLIAKNRFEIANKYNILISRKKAFIYCLRKQSS